MKLSGLRRALLPVWIGAAVAFALAGGASAQFGRVPDEFSPGCVQAVNETGRPITVKISGDGWESTNYWPVGSAKGTVEWLVWEPQGQGPNKNYSRLLVVDDETTVWATKSDGTNTPKQFLKNDPAAKYMKMPNPNCYDADRRLYEWSWRKTFR
jgi:hypothetical protein